MPPAGCGLVFMIYNVKTSPGTAPVISKNVIPSSTPAAGMVSLKVAVPAPPAVCVNRIVPSKTSAFPKSKPLEANVAELLDILQDFEQSLGGDQPKQVAA